MLLLTKLRPPPLKSHTVPRERLLRRLRSGIDRRVCLIACPAGFGKTSLLAQWSAQEAGARSEAWVTVDADDNDPVLLWTHVVTALRGALPALDATPDWISASGLTSLFLPRLVNSLYYAGDVLLVLDDVHRLTDRAAAGSLAWFIEHSPLEPTVRPVYEDRSSFQAGSVARQRRVV